MRRLFVGMAMMATMSMPLCAWSGDREIAEQIIAKLKTHRDSGALKDFKVDLKVNDGVVAFNGSVASLTQRDLVLNATKSVDGIKDIVDDMKLPAAAAPTLVKAKPVVQAVPSDSTRPTIEKPQPTMIVDAAPRTVVKPAADIQPSPVAGIVKPASGVVVPEAIAQPTAGPVTQLASSVEPIVVAPVGRKTPVAAVAQPTAGDQDRELNAKITRALTQAKQDGRLRGFAMDITTNGGDVWLQGRTVTDEQREAMLEIVRNVPGVTNVIDDVKVMIQAEKKLVRQASDSVPVFAAAPVPMPMPAPGLAPATIRPVPRPAAVAQAAPQAGMTRSPARMMPVPYRPSTMPHPYAQASGGMMVQGATMQGGRPMPMQPASAGMAHGSPRHDQPNLPNYAWPGYSAYPNYAALSYPKQYSPSAWPYIGPFYPYPQVPLNWRKVTLEWDDGWWQLDYSSKSR